MAQQCVPALAHTHPHSPALTRTRFSHVSIAEQFLGRRGFIEGSINIMGQLTAWRHGEPTQQDRRIDSAGPEYQRQVGGHGRAAALRTCL